jgi:hypothetical protein
MSKRFHVESGYRCRIGRCWHDHTVTLFVEEDEVVEVWTVFEGMVLERAGAYACAELDAEAPPAGLRPAR